jgi:hypothetical protein
MEAPNGKVSELERRLSNLNVILEERCANRLEKIKELTAKQAKFEESLENVKVKLAGLVFVSNIVVALIIHWLTKG